MKKLHGMIAVILVMVFALTGCGGATDAVSNAANAVSTAMAQLLSGEVTGEVGKTYGTQWFEFTIKSIDEIDEYAGYTPEDGNQLIDVVINEKCTFEESCPMGTFDFYVDHDSFPDYIFPMDPLDDTMMPEEFDLAPDEVVEYHMVFEIPEDLNDRMLVYTEIDEQDNVGTVFTIYF